MIDPDQAQQWAENDRKRARDQKLAQDRETLNLLKGPSALDVLDQLTARLRGAVKQAAKADMRSTHAADLLDAVFVIETLTTARASESHADLLARLGMLLGERSQARKEIGQ